MTGTTPLVGTDTILCTHATPGKVTVAATGRLTVAGAAVLLATDVTGADVVCAASPPPQGIVKCSKVATVTAGPAARLTVGGTAVVLDSLAGTTDGLPPPIGLTVTAGQQRLTVGATP